MQSLVQSGGRVQRHDVCRNEDVRLSAQDKVAAPTRLEGAWSESH